MDKIKILIANDDKDEQRKYAHMISSRSDMKLLATASTGYEAVLEAALLSPDIILMDDDMESPGCGILAAKTILKKLPHMKIILLTDNHEEDVINHASRVGITDYILKSSKPSEVVKTIKEVHKLSHPGQQNIREKHYRRNLHPKGVQDSLMYTLTVVSLLTPSELEITKLIVDGKDIREIADIRNMDIAGVNEYIRRILHKFNKESVDELVKVLQTLNITEILNHIV